MSATLPLEIAAAAARLVVEDGMEYGPAKRRAARQLGARDADLPDNQLLEDEVRAYLQRWLAPALRDRTAQAAGGPVR